MRGMMFVTFVDVNHVTHSFNAARIHTISLSCLMPRPTYNVLFDNGVSIPDLHEAYDGIPFWNENSKSASDAVQKFFESLKGE